jgi:hypothetical protein
LKWRRTPGRVPVPLVWSPLQPKLRRPEAAPPKSWRGFIEQDGYVSIEAEHFARKTATATARWEVLPDHGKTVSALTIFPVTAPTATPPQNSPALEYDLWLTRSGPVEVTTILSPGLNFDPTRPVRYAVSVNDAPPQIITIVPQGYNAGDGNRDWEESVKNGVRKVKSQHALAAPGAHTLKIWMVDPAVTWCKKFSWIAAD